MVHRNFGTMRRSRPASRRRGKNRLMLETLERRELLTTTWTVNSIGDTGAGSGNSGDLRYCITQVNATSGTQVIDFDIAATGVQTIKLASPLPTITHAVTIDGTSEGSAQGQTGYTGTPLIDIDGTALSTTQTVLTVAAGGSTIQALAINNCAGTAITLQTSGGDTVLGCFIGTTADGTKAAANGVGIDISGSSNNTIGGTGTNDRNIISGNTGPGIRVGATSASNGNVIVGNSIGTDITGANPLGNQYGIVLDQSSNDTIGGTATGAGNVISGNLLDGIDATSSGSSGDVIQGNLVGTSTQPTGQGLHVQTGFAGMQYNDTTGYIPPDTEVAVGQTNVLETVQTTLRIFAKTGTVVSTTQLGSFFPTANATNLGTPVVFYDDILKRFVVAALEEDGTAASSYLDVAFSDVGKETTFSNVYRLGVAEGNSFADGLRFGFNANAIVFTFNMFDASSFNFTNVQILSVDPTSIGQSNLGTVKLDRTNDFSDTPATMHGATSTDPMYFVEANNQFTAPYNDVHVLTWANPLNASSSFTDTDVTVPTYYDPTSANQLGTTSQIDTIDIRILSAAWRNNSLVAAGNTDNASGDPNVRWYDFSTALSTPSLVQSGNINQGSGVATYFPSIDIDPSGDLGMTFMESSSNEYMSMYVTGQLAGLTNGTMLTPVLAQAGVAPYTPTIDTTPYYAGYFSGIGVSPTDGSFWSANEYAIAAQANANWGTWIQQFSVQSSESFKYVALANHSNGIVLNGPTNVLIGGTVAAAANVIGANLGDGIQILGGSSGVQVEGNFIGTDPNGDGSLGNVGNGVTVLSSQNTIGGTIAAAGNVVSGNSLDGVLVSQVGGGATSSGNLIEWNTIGAAPNGGNALPNLKQGIHLEAVHGTSILDNLVSGNGQNGIMLDVQTINNTGYGNTNTLIQGNEIGTDIAGSTPLTNTLDGIMVIMSTNTTIGGMTTATANVISGNTQNGIELANSGSVNSSGTLIEGNIIGLDVTGHNILANSNDGIWQHGADGTTIGGTVNGARNIISGNKSDGIALGAGNNALVQGNYIGTDITGTQALGNSTGLLWNDASYATVGGTSAAARNIISGNSSGGMNSFTLNSVGDEVIEGNYIGVDVSGVKALPNGTVGIRIAGPLNNTIGGTAPGAGNVISGNNGDGIEFTVGSGAGTLIEGNQIGTDATGTVALGNSGTGIVLWSNSITIGGTTADAGNIIAYNGKDGIGFIFNVNDNAILSNSIFGNSGLGINFANGPTANHPWPPGVSPGSGPNNYQNYPVLTSAISSGGNTTIQGSLNAAPSTQFLVQFFSNATEGPSGYGQGQTYLGSELVTTDTTSNVTFSAVLTGVSVPNGYYVTATATDPSSNTSEFGKDVVTKAVVSVNLGVTAQPSTGTTTYAGSTLIYTLTVTNSSTESDPDVVVTDQLDANVTYQTATSSISTAKISQASGTVTADLGVLAANSSATVTIYVTVNAGGVPHVTNNASISTSDSNIGSPTAVTTVTSVSPATDLTISSISTTQAPNYAGANLVYTITAVNTGPSSATGVTVVDTLPAIADVTFVSATTSVSGVTPSVAGNVVTADFGNLASGTPVTLTVTVVPTAAAVAASPLTDSASITGNEYDPTPANNSLSASTTITPSADLTVGIVPSPSPVEAGKNVTYTITATNNGPSAATGVIVTDTIPGDVTFVSATGNVTPNGSGVITFNVGNLADNGTATFHVTVTAQGTSASPTTDTATITGGQYDPNTGNNSANVSVPITPVSDLQVAMNAAPNPVYVGANLVYTITASNTGPSTEPAAVVSDTIPANLTIVSAITSLPGVAPVITGQLVIANLGSLAAGATPVTVTITVSPTASAAGQVTNTASISGQNVDNSPPNELTASTTTTVDPSADLAVKVTASGTDLVGQSLIYTVTATNNGPSPATGVMVTDTLPALTDVTNVSAVASVSGVTPSVAGNMVTADFGDLNANASVTLTITVTPTVAAVADSPLVDTASVSGSQHDPNSSNNNAQVSSTIAPAVDLIVNSFTTSPSLIQIGDSLTYTIDVTNSGPSPATAVTVTSPLGDATYVAGSGTATDSGTVSLQGSQVVATFATLAANSTAKVTYALIPGAIGQYTATTMISANETDTDTTNNTATVSTTVLDRVGTIEFSSTGYSAPENAGSATLTVSRVNGSRGTATVQYTTVPQNATPGIDYTPVSATLTFAPGVTSQTIVVPVLENPYDNHNELLSVVLSNVQTSIPAGEPGQAILGTPSTSTLTIIDIDPNYTPVNVTNVQTSGTAQNIQAITVTFNKPLIAKTATDFANYTLVNLGPDARYGSLDDTGVQLGTATYNSSTWTVTLIPSSPLADNQFFHLMINGASPGGIEDIGNNMLAGNGSTAGTDFTAMLADGTNLRYYTPAGDQVNLKITGGGIIDDLLSGSGQGIRLSVVGEVPHHTVLSGTVKKSPGGTGEAYVGYTLWGLGQFGDVRVKMYSPMFQVSEYPFSPGFSASSAQAKVSLDGTFVVSAVARSGKTLLTTKAGRVSKKAVVPESRIVKQVVSSGTASTMNRPFHAFRH